MSELKFSRRVMLGGSLFMVSAAALVGCKEEATDVEIIAQNGQFFTANELTILADVSEIMIPKTETPGAIDAQVASVVDALMLTWANEGTRQQFRDELAAYNTRSQTSYGKDYLKLSKEERTALLVEVDKEAFSEEPFEGAEGYRRVKYLVFRAYYTSESGSADHVPVPGGYYGDLTLAEYNELMAERSYGG